MMRDVRKYGAAGDGVTPDTAAIQRAIDDGGVIFFPPGHYLTGTLYLRDNTHLYIGMGAELLASPDLNDYNKADFVPQNGASKAECTSGGHLIVAHECTNVMISGGGKITGNSSAWLTQPDPSCPILLKTELRPAQMLWFCECTNVRIMDLDLGDAPYWHCFIWGCEDVMIRNVRIRGNRRVQNSDGIDVDCSKNVIISDCNIDTSDDCITMRAVNSRLKTPRACENVLVQNCILQSAYANTIRIGVGGGEICNVVFDNLMLLGYLRGIKMNCSWNTASRGVNIHDIEFRNIRNFTRCPVTMRGNNCHLPTPPNSAMHHIRFRNISGTLEQSCFIEGENDLIKDISFENIDFVCHGKGPSQDLSADGLWGHFSTDAVFELHDLKEVLFRNVKIRYADGTSGWTTECRAVNAENLHVENCHFPLS